MSRLAVVGALALVWAGGCGSADSVPVPTGEEPVSRAASAIQGGTTDMSHAFTVGIVQQSGQNIALCSGLLLAPNLVATARHCVSLLTSAQIDCATSAFMGTVPESNILVTPDATLPMTANGYYSVAKNGIIVPSPASVCGNDIALLILTQSITLPQYVTPTINPPMTDHQAYTTAYTAIGYGVNSPVDTTGMTAGVRRIRENINFTCIPNDKAFTDCYTLYANAMNFIAPSEFVGGDGTCEGDSGSGALDQGSFNTGKWVAFGVLSRGGVTAEGGTCAGSVYTRFDAWGSLIVQAATEAAALGQYPPPSWTQPDASSASTGDAGSVTGSSSSGGTVPACLLNASACPNGDSDCCSVNCVSFDKGVTFRCAACDDSTPCSSGFGCVSGVCVKGALSTTVDAGTGGSHSSGCAVNPERRASAGGAAGFAGVGLGCAALTRRRRRSATGSPPRASEKGSKTAGLG